MIHVDLDISSAARRGVVALLTWVASDALLEPGSGLELVGVPDGGLGVPSAPAPMHPARGATPAPRFAILIGTESSGPSMTYQQTDAIRDHVFPLFDLPAEEAGPAKPRFMGTGFFVGRRGYALTAAHVMRGASRAAAGMAGPDGWLGFSILSREEHPREDVALLNRADLLLPRRLDSRRANDVARRTSVADWRA